MLQIRHGDILFLLSSVHVCAYGNVTSDTGMACSGDSGGPMVVRENERSELLFNSDYSNNCVQEYLDWCYKLWCATIHK